MAVIIVITCMIIRGVIIETPIFLILTPTRKFRTAEDNACEATGGTGINTF